MTERRADLHVHTNASDGMLTPEQVVDEAARLGLAGIGIADHDTVNGVLPAVNQGERVGITVVPAIEINTDYAEKEVHLLGYFIDPESDKLHAHLDRIRLARVERGAEMVRRLNKIGINISMDRVKEIAGTGSLGRPHVARALVEAGYSSGMNAAFGKYLTPKTPGYVPRYKLTPFEAIEIIREAGGVAVVAHPGHFKHDEWIPDFINAGLQGIEAAHTDHSSAQRRRYIRLARKYGLIATGGSDYHGPDMLKMISIGHMSVDMAVVEELREKSAQPR